MKSLYRVLSNWCVVAFFLNAHEKVKHFGFINPGIFALFFKLTMGVFQTKYKQKEMIV
jgi:hypothetical protein